MFVNLRALPSYDRSWRRSRTLQYLKRGHVHKLKCSIVRSIVRLGELDVNTTIDEEAKPIDVGIKEVIPHPQYSNRPILNDIALLHLNESIKYTGKHFLSVNT